MGIDKTQEHYDMLLPSDVKDHVECKQCKLWFPLFFMRDDMYCENCSDELPIEDEIE